MFEKMLGYANHLGLYSEMTGLRGQALGNFPQAFSHLGLISAAYNLNRTLDGSGASYSGSGLARIAQEESALHPGAEPSAQPGPTGALEESI